MATTTERTALAVGQSALTGWRGKVGGAVAKPVAERTRFSEEQVRAAIGFALMAYAIYRLVRPIVRAARADR
jgi:copper oxidase (laccase) domain-containing protein